MEKLARDIQEKYRLINKNKGENEWTYLEYGQGLVGDMGDLMKMLMAKSNFRGYKGNLDAFCIRVQTPYYQTGPLCFSISHFKRKISSLKKIFTLGFKYVKVLMKICCALRWIPKVLLFRSMRVLRTSWA